MSSFKNAAKSRQHVHRERPQLESRKHLGHLERKKDYKLRAEDYQKKQRTIKALKRKALDKNPDEFYFKMIRTQLKDGVHEAEDTTPVYTDDQLKMMQSQDLKYVNHKRQIEMKKIEKLKSSLHLLDAEDKPKNTHIVFVDTKKEAKNFDPAKYLDTHPDLLEHTFNRPRMETLRGQTIKGELDEETIEKIKSDRRKQYTELTRRIEREKQLSIIAQKMEMKRHLTGKQSRKKKVADETKESAAIYKWMPQRQR
ncbi:unnamed protein product [Owenia fusiformis]|uniref:U3 small nucleolar RNA-associated protein 11 n=1 Tax=Owenia fusiformis TaxID=6347 RepID=A0A8J1TC95_OWEFU|nr:unnamed protein product [Owenia fusiformis]